MATLLSNEQVYCLDSSLDYCLRWQQCTKYVESTLSMAAWHNEKHVTPSLHCTEVDLNPVQNSPRLEDSRSILGTK